MAKITGSNPVRPISPFVLFIQRRNEPTIVKNSMLSLRFSLRLGQSLLMLLVQRDLPPLTTFSMRLEMSREQPIEHAGHKVDMAAEGNPEKVDRQA